MAAADVTHEAPQVVARAADHAAERVSRPPIWLVPIRAADRARARQPVCESLQHPLRAWSSALAAPGGASGRRHHVAGRVDVLAPPADAGRPVRGSVSTDWACARADSVESGAVGTR